MSVLSHLKYHLEKLQQTVEENLKIASSSLSACPKLSSNASIVLVKVAGNKALHPAQDWLQNIAWDGSIGSQQCHNWRLLFIFLSDSLFTCCLLTNYRCRYSRKWYLPALPPPAFCFLPPSVPCHVSLTCFLRDSRQFTRIPLFHKSFFFFYLLYSFTICCSNNSFINNQ